MPHVYELLRSKVADWRAAGYPCDDYPAVGEILDYARLPEGRVLRRYGYPPDLRASATEPVLAQAGLLAGAWAG
jgi:hypothetical protein